tara:strand:- start:87303 stop:89837 length:2535 start_codon:yes stop_codon:yes gene_type:complete
MLQIFQIKLLTSFLFCLFITQCSTTKKLPTGQKLLSKQIIVEDNQKINPNKLNDLLSNNPNKKIFGLPVKLYLNNLVNQNQDSLFDIWIDKNPKKNKILNKIFSKKQINQLKKYRVSINNWLKTNSEAPTIMDSTAIKKNINRMNQYYNNLGYFDNKTSYLVENISDTKSKVTYQIFKGNQYRIDSVKTKIESKTIEEIYNNHFNESFLKPNDFFSVQSLSDERDRLLKLFRNNGIFDFEQSSIRFKVFLDSIKSKKTIPIDVEISDQKKRLKDSLVTIPYSVRKINNVNVLIRDPDNYNDIFSDTLKFNNINILSSGKLNYKPQVISDFLTLKQGDTYSEQERSNTFKYFSELKNFKYPIIDLKEDEIDSLRLNIDLDLTPMEKYSLGLDLDLSHSNIEDFGIGLGASIISRNIFKRADFFEFVVKGSVGSSKNVTTSNDFFNLIEFGSDINLNIPKIIFPFNVNSIIPRSSSPRTKIVIGTSIQENVGLDRQNFSSKIEYEWTPKPKFNINFKLLDFEFIKNRAVNNYFYVYRNSYDRLNFISKSINFESDYLDNNRNLLIPIGTNFFIDEVKKNNTSIFNGSANYQNIMDIDARKKRLTSDNFIFGSSISFTKNTQENIFDEDFSQYKFKFEWVGNLINRLIKRKNNDNLKEIYDVIPSQFIKSEVNYIKHWRISKDNVLAFRYFSGIAIPYGNSDNIPFTRSYFGGGSNDNRAWRVYKLGPGSSKNENEFNEANLKIAFNIEYRFPILGSVKGALFIDFGNIWNVLDNVNDEKMKFNGLKDLNEIAIGSGFGIRYDFNFFIFRLDTGFKTYDPSLEVSDRWFKNTSLRKAVFNIGINYPF